MQCPGCGHCRFQAYALRREVKTNHPEYLLFGRLQAAPFISVLSNRPSRSKSGQTEEAGRQSVVQPLGVILLPEIVLLT